MAELTALGAPSTGNADEADLIVVNTCDFIDAAKEESLEAIVETTRLKISGPFTGDDVAQNSALPLAAAR
jgi:ribosomal protein S12 methylthiotransferase